VGILDDFTFNHAADGSNRKNKFERDANLLIDGLKVEPNNSRYMFYLAQSYKDLGKWKDAIKYYEMRTKAGGWVEEIYYSLYQMGKCMIYDGEPYERFKKVLLDAYYYRPSRLESLYTLLLYCRTNGKCEDGYSTWGEITLEIGKHSAKIMANTENGTYAYNWFHTGDNPIKFLKDLDMYYAKDDEGNGFQKVNYSPTIMFKRKESGSYDIELFNNNMSEEEIKYEADIEEDEYIYDVLEKVVCINWWIHGFINKEDTIWILN